MEYLEPFIFPPLPQIFARSFVFHRFIQSTALLLCSYFFFLLSFPSIQTKKQKSWLLTLIASFILMIGANVSLLHLLFDSKGDFSKHPTESRWDLSLSIFFLSYLFTDLIVGLFHYAQYLDPLSAWIHHIGYIILISHLIHKNLTTPFCIMAVMEIPTFILSLGHVWKHLRNDLLFGAAFFVTRIAFHAYMIYQFYFHFPVEGSWWLVVGGIYPLHCYWFTGWLKQQKKLKQKKSMDSLKAKEVEEEKGVVLTDSLHIN